MPLPEKHDIQCEVMKPSENLQSQDPQLVSVIIAAYNSRQTLPSTLKSLQSQTYQSWEAHVVFDEGTQDGSDLLAQETSRQDPRIHVHRISGRGVAKARNWGLEYAQGTWCAFLDADDLWLPHKLEQQVNFMKANKIQASCTGYRRFNSDRTGKLILPPFEQSYGDILKDNRIGFSTSMFGRKSLKVPKLEERPQEDFIFWLDLLRWNQISCFGLQEDLVRYRVLPVSRSTRDPRLRSRWQILRHRESLTLRQSLWTYSHYFLSALAKRVVF